jgi:signal transduction histidine kinase
LREANERLVIATMRADDLLTEATAARAVAVDNEAIAAERTRRAEELAARLAKSEQALRASEAQARAASRAKDEFVAMLGHELRNPLAPILTALELIAMDDEDVHRREHTIIEHQATHMSRLVDDLLDVSRIDRGTIELRCEPMEIGDAVTRAVEMAGPLIESNRHSLCIEIPKHGLAINGDMDRLTQVVANLLANAAKYTPPGGVLTISGERRGMHIVLRVRDSGIGISSDMLPRVFDLFAQEEQPLDRAPGGLGLGLTIVRSLVALHGGTVTAHSAGLGFGSEFVVTLPTHSPPAFAGEMSPRTHARVTPRKILVVDDNRLAAELTGVALTKLGHDVRVAFDGASALQIANEFIPHVALLDIGLPGMDGYELVRRLRGVWSTASVRFVAITGYGEQSDQERSMSAGFDAHVVKPVDLMTLERDIDRAPL